MKKLLMMAALAGFAFASCTNDNEESYEANKAPQRITFASPVMYGNTRANIMDAEQGGTVGGTHIAYNKKETFRVFGVKYDAGKWGVNQADVYGVDGEEAFYSQSLGGWDTQLPRFWEAGKDYAFAAYSPNIVAGTVAYDWTNGLTVNGYQTPAIGQQYDMMYAPAVKGLNDQSQLAAGTNGNNDGYNGVNLVFKHALSSVHFKVCVHKDEPLNEKNFTLNSITLAGVQDKGNFAENAATGAAAWTDQAGTTSYDFVAEPYSPSKVAFNLADDVKSVNAANHIGFMVPQTLPEATQIVINYTVNLGTEQEPNMKDFTKTIVLNAADLMPVTAKWEMGKRYTYTIALTASNRIYFAPSVDDWTDVEPTPGNNPIVL